MGKKTETLNLRVSAEFKELVRKAAAEEHRTIANFIEVVVRQHCDRTSVGASEELAKRPKSR